MSTNAVIAVRTNENTVKAIYLHCDGYIENAGKLLINNYNSLEMAEKIVNLGDLSSLKKRLSPDKHEIHSFEKPINDVTVAYHRDRGEDLHIMDLPWSENSQCMLKILKDAVSSAEYAYIFNDDKWFAADFDHDDILKPLEDFEELNL